MSISISEALSADQLADAALVRYRVYCAERGLFVDAADHSKRSLLDPVDQLAHVWVAYVDGQPVGTIRVIWAAECAVDDDLERNFTVSSFLELVPPERIITFGRFMILPEHRSDLVSGLLLNAVSEFSFERSIDVGFCDCEPPLVPYYEAIGFRSYRESYNDPEIGIKVPMVLLAADRAHLRRIGSFVLPLVPDTIRPEPEPEISALVTKAEQACAITGASLASERIELLERGTALGALFDGVSEAVIHRVIDESVLVRFKAGDMLIKEGHASRALWWLLDGHATVTAQGAHAGTRQPGDVAGEIAMLVDSRRVANVKAETNGHALVIPDHTVLSLLHSGDEESARLFFNLAASLARKMSSILGVS